MRNDPLLACNFRLELLDAASSPAAAVTTIALAPLVTSPVAGFSECTGLEMTMDTEDYEEGGNNGTVLRFPKRHKWGDITLRKGITHDQTLFEWYYGFTEGITQRKDGLIILMDERHEPHTVWRFRRGLPVKYVAPQLNAQQSNVAIETLSIAHEGISLMGGAAGLASAIGAAAGAIGEAIGDLF